MQRMKTFGLYALCVILFFIFSNVMINVALKASYNPIDTYKTEPKGIGIDINEAKATYINGYIGGKIINQNETIERTYLKIDLYTKHDVNLGSKYIEFNNLKQNESREFRIGFKFTDVDHAVITIVDEVPEQVPQESFKSDNIGGAVLITTVIFLCFFG